MDWNTQKIFQIFPFYNTCIGRSKIQKLSNLQLLEERPFYDELSIVKTIKTNSAFSGYGRSYKIENVDEKDPLVQLQVSKSSIICFIKQNKNKWEY